MHPILFHIPGLDFPIRSFGVMLAIGFLVGSWLLSRLAERYGDDPKGDPARFSRITVWVLVGVVIGARLMYVIVEMARGSAVGHEFRSSPMTIFAVWQGGLVMYGGMFGAIVAGTWCARREKLRVAHAFDIGMVAGFIGQAIGRVGCLLAGCCYGRPFAPFGRHPAPLYEAVLCLVLAAVCVVGDLAESVIKRCLEVKDSGNFLPGIGGSLDLIDSLLFTAPVFYFYLWYVSGQPI